jgi:putative ABC transport system permease protein
LEQKKPPQRPLQFLRWFCREDYIEEIEGDLTEVFIKLAEINPGKAKLKFTWSVIRYFRPMFMKSFSNSHQPNSYGMYKSYFKIGWRNLVRNRVYSLINIGGLAIGMAVAILIGLWIYDELSFNNYHLNYNRIAQVKQHQSFNGKIETWPGVPPVLSEELRNSYGDNFKYVVMTTWPEGHFLNVGDKQIPKIGHFMEKDGAELLSLKMIRGNRNALSEPSSILLSASTATVFFGNEDPMGKDIKIDNKLLVKVAGVYEDIPLNSDFNSTQFITTWHQKLLLDPWIKTLNNPWGMNGMMVYVQLAEHAEMKMSSVSNQIKDSKLKNVPKYDEKYKPEIFLHPMSRWHLFEKFESGKNEGGKIEFVWLFGMVGVFVLLLACINFMNLSTARSEKRAKEVGIRKAIGSVRSQLISQFFSESFLVVLLAFALAVVCVLIALPFFNSLANKQMIFPWVNPVFWFLSGGFCLFTGLIAGSYPAFYLSSFNPVKVLKGTFKVGRFASLPRKVLVVTQFTISITLIVGTVVVFQQIQYAKDRPIGYNRDALTSLQLFTNDIHTHFESFRNELINTGAVVEIAESSGPLTGVWSSNGDIEWEGKDPGTAVDFPNTSVSFDFGKTVGWEFVAGRDFSREFPSDSIAFVINESAVKFMGLKNPVGEIMKWDGHPFKVIGVIKDMVMQSPYQAVQPSIFNAENYDIMFIHFKLNSNQSLTESVSKVETIFKKFAPEAPFDYKFADEEYARKFGDEERIGKLASVFSTLAILISCLGLFGLASFIAEQKTKEIGIRKVLGASVTNLWRMLSTDFVVLVLLSCLIAIPISYYFLNDWLKSYDYRTEISWWIFLATGIGALAITLLTVSFQAIKAAMMNPVNSLKSE